MKTLVYSIKLSDENKEIIKSLQYDYSVSFRKMYNNMDVMVDKTFLDSLKINSTRQKEYLQKEVLGFYKKNLYNKNRIQQNILNLEQKDNLTLKQYKHLQYLKKSYNKNVVFGDKQELVKLSKNCGDKNIWKQSRLLPLVFYGEVDRKGNRFFDFKELKDGKILFKMACTKIRIPLLINAKKHNTELLKLCELCSAKKIPLTVKLTYDKIYLTFDESILNNTNVDIKSFYKEISHVKDKIERKRLIANKHREHESYLKRGKLERYLNIDLNPDGIGYSITDKNRIIKKGYLDISKIYDANKRKYETSILIKELFKLISYYKCSYIVTEELDLKNTDLGNKVSNRKINNLWNRLFIKELINKRCTETGTIQIEINPCYTSFIGNIMYEEYDPIAASLEIGRRGYHKYSKGGFYPEINFTNFINDERYDKIKDCLSWKDMYSLFVTSKWSYRRKRNDFRFSAYDIGNKKSGCQHLHF